MNSHRALLVTPVLMLATAPPVDTDTNVVPVAPTKAFVGVASEAVKLVNAVAGEANVTSPLRFTIAPAVVDWTFDTSRLGSAPSPSSSR